MLRPFLKNVEWKPSKDQNTTGASLLWSRETVLDINHNTEQYNHSPATVTDRKKG